MVSEVCAGDTGEGLERKRERRGKALWADPQPVPPWEWRRAKKFHDP